MQSGKTFVSTTILPAVMAEMEEYQTASSMQLNLMSLTRSQVRQYKGCSHEGSLLAEAV